MNTYLKSMASKATIAIASATIAACAADSGNGTGVNTPKADVNAAFVQIPEWREYSPLIDSKNEVDPSAIVTQEDEIVGTNLYKCTSTQYNLTETPREIVMFSPNASVMWLGNLIQGEGYKQGLGSFTELSVRERAPLKISIDLLTEENFRVVENPSLITVQSAVGDLVQLATESGVQNSVDATYSEEYSHSVKQSALSFGISANYMGADASTSLETSKSAEETTLTAYFYQKMFTASIELPSTPADFFSEDFTQEKLDALTAEGAIGADNPPVYIANIAYGRILMYSFTSTANEDLMRAAINASYEGISGGASGYSEGQIRNTLNTAKIEVTALGGEGSNLTDLIREGNLSSYFTSDPALTSARPISYQLNQLKVGNPIAKVSETTDYSIRECTFIQDTAQPIGEKIRVKLNDVSIKYDCDATDPGDMYGHFSINGFVVYNRGEKNTINVSGGDQFSIDQSLTLDVYYGNTTRNISGRLKDRDVGSDDTVGSWDFDINLLNTGTKTKTGSNQCGSSSKKPVLNYKVTRVEYLY